MGAQVESTVTDKYHHRKKVKCGKPSIYIAYHDSKNKATLD